MNAIRIIETPPGEAPPEIRAAWVGLVLPLVVPGKRTQNSAGVLSGPKTVIGWLWWLLRKRLDTATGYSVDALTAFAILERSDPAAAHWWKQNVPHLFAPGRRLIFAAHVCEETTPPIWPPPPERRV